MGVVKIENRSGPRIDLCGTSVESLTDEDRRPLTATNCTRPERYERSHRNRKVHWHLEEGYW